MKVLALCAGYGGLEIAVAAGLGGQVVAFAENDPFAAAVFAAHHPGVSNLGDITRADWHTVRELYRPDVVAAGFPCRNISNAGRRDGINGQWSRVWKDVAAAVGVLRPRFVFLENVAAIRSRGLDVVAADLAALGYDARWTCYELVTPPSAPRTRATAGGASPIPLLKTPTRQLGVNGGPQPPDKRKAGGHGPTLEDEVVFLLPPPPPW
jgi:DNA (cytosine-5)-methyltransferase 1